MKKHGKNRQDESSMKQNEVDSPNVEQNSDNVESAAGIPNSQGPEYASGNSNPKDTQGKKKKPFYKRVWFWVIVVIIIACLAGGSDDSDDEEEDGHIYDDAELIDVIKSGTESEVLGQYSLIEAKSTDVTLEDLEDWYFNYITETDYEWYVIIYTDRDDNSGVYGGGIYVIDGIIFRCDEDNVYRWDDQRDDAVYYRANEDETGLEEVTAEERIAEILDDDDDDTTDEDTTDEDAIAEDATEEDAAEEETTEEEVAEAATEETAEEEINFQSVLTALGTFEEITYTGSGDDVITLENPGYPVIMDITYSGESNFIVHSVDSYGEDVDLLVNTVGSYSGTVTDYTDYSDVTMLSVNSSGEWSITVKPMDSMLELVNGQSYTGDGVYYIETDELTTLTITNSGESNFIVRGIGISDTDLLVNDIGDYSGTVIWTEPWSFLIVLSEGTWTVSW